MEIEELEHLLDQLNLWLNLASVVCGLIVVVVIFGCMYMSYEMMDRVSIRFTVAISIVDVIKALIIIFYTEFTENGWICTGIAFLIYYLTLVYLFLNVAVAFNLQLVFVHGIVLSRELVLWAVSLGLPLVLLLPPLYAGKLGLNEIGVCELIEPTSYETDVYLFACFISWGILAILYCTIVVVLVTRQLHRKTNILDKVVRTNNADLNSNNLALKNKIRKLIGRVSWYCIIPIVTQLWYLIMRSIVYHVEYLPNSMFFLATVGTDIPGILNLLVLLLDPAFASALESILRKKSIPVPSFLDSRLPTEISPPFTLEPILPDTEDEVGYFVPLRRVVRSITPEPSIKETFFSCFVPRNPGPLNDSKQIEMSLLTQSTSDISQYTHEATSFIRRI